MTIYIGTSGFSYNDWIGVFYPEDIRQNEWHHMDSGATICMSDWKGLETEYMPGFSFYYLRRHGPKGAPEYAGSYTGKDIESDAKMIQTNMKGKDVFVYYNNDISGYAVKNALALKQLLG